MEKEEFIRKVDEKINEAVKKGNFELAYQILMRKWKALAELVKN